MKRTIAAVSMTLTAALALTLTGCGPSTTIKTKAIDEATSSAAAAISSAAAKLSSAAASKAATPETTSAAAPETTSAAPSVAHIGSSITLNGNDDDEQVVVTLVKVAPMAESSNDYVKPDAGKRFYGAQFRLRNTGTAVYSDSPDNGAKAVDSQGQQFDTTYGEITAGPSFGGSVKLAPGSSALGWITFEVAKASKITDIQFALNSGFADDVGQWKTTAK